MQAQTRKILLGVMKHPGMWVLLALAIAAGVTSYRWGKGSYAQVGARGGMYSLTAEEYLPIAESLYGMGGKSFERDYRQVAEDVAEIRVWRRVFLGTAVALLLVTAFTAWRTVRRLKEESAPVIEVGPLEQSSRYVYFGGLTPAQERASHAIQDHLERQTGKRLDKPDLHPYLTAIRRSTSSQLDAVITGALPPDRLLAGVTPDESDRTPP